MSDDPSARRPGKGQPTILSVIAPCLNEEECVDLLAKRTLATFDSMGIPAELLLIDDGSSDDTWNRIRRQAGIDSRVRGLKHLSNRGMEAAWRTGVEAAAGELVCLIDADLQNRPEDIAKLYATYRRERPDVVQAVRHAVPGLRRYATFSRGLNFLLNLAFRMHSRDNKSGFILCRAEVLRAILTHRYRYRYFQCFIGASAKTQGYSIAEVDTVFDDRHGGDSFLGRFPIGVSLRTFWELVKFRVETWCRAPNTDPWCAVDRAVPSSARRSGSPCNVAPCGRPMPVVPSES
jgi:glycosyltransferase involved in cell wall biosynthesis